MKTPPIARPNTPATAALVEVVQPVVVGRIGQAYGIKGWLKLQSFTSPEENIAQYNPLYLTRPQGYQPVNVTDFKPHGKGFVIHLEGCDDRTLAGSYVGLEIVIAKSQLPPLKEGEYYLVELEGMTVYTLKGVKLGTVTYLMQTGANEVLVIDGEKQHLVPLIMGHFVHKVDKKERQIIVDWDPEF